MADIFVEQIIKKNTSLGGWLLRIGAVIVMLLALAAFPIVLMKVGGLFFLFVGLLVLLGYLTYLAFVYTSVEYEYSFVNGELEIDRILGKRKRKKGETYDIKKAELIAKTNSEYINRVINDVTKVDYSATNNIDNKYSILFSEMDGVRGAFMITIEPDERLLDALYHVRPNIMKR